MMRKRFFFVLILFISQLSNVSSAMDNELPKSRKSGDKFLNIHPVNTRDISNFPAIAKAWVTDKHRLSEPDYGIIPITKIDPKSLVHGEDLAFYRLGHSTLLISLNQQWWLIDPVFSKRASPVQWAGPKRFHDLVITIDELPPIAGVIISHDHYDHLDKASIKKLKNKVEQFIVPLGVDQHLKDWGVNTANITALDWWDAITLHGVDITATPAQHFSGRGITGGDETLWASWVIKNDTRSVFYSGDGGYFDGFKTIGEQLGPFDLTFVETGAYNDLWQPVHMLPEESVQAHTDVKGQYMVPVHNSTFDLALHAWYEPLERVYKAAVDNNVNILTPVIGQRVELSAPASDIWWANLVEGQEKVSIR